MLHTARANMLTLTHAHTHLKTCARAWGACGNSVQGTRSEQQAAGSPLNTLSGGVCSRLVVCAWGCLASAVCGRPCACGEGGVGGAHVSRSSITYALTPPSSDHASIYTARPLATSAGMLAPAQAEWRRGVRGGARVRVLARVHTCVSVICEKPMAACASAASGAASLRHSHHRNIDSQAAVGSVSTSECVNREPQHARKSERSSLPRQAERSVSRSADYNAPLGGSGGRRGRGSCSCRYEPLVSKPAWCAHSE